MPEEMQMSLAEFRALRVPMDWREAVAIIQELAHTINRSGRDAEVPDLDHLILAIVAPSGMDRRARNHPQVLVRRGGAPPDHPVRAIARLLQELVEGASPPPQLRLLISQDAAKPPLHSTVTEFSGALRSFERPDRLGDIAKVLSRARDAQDDSSAREDAKAAEPTRLDRALEWARSQSPVTVLIAGLVVAVLVPALWFGSGQSSETWFALKDRAGQTIASARRLAGSTVDALGTLFPESTPEVLDGEGDSPIPDPDPPRAVAATVQVAPADSQRAQSSPSVARPIGSVPRLTRSVPRLTGTPVALLDTRAVASQQRDGAGRPSLVTDATSAPTREVGASVGDSDGLYTSGDQDVVPPSFTHPKLPSVTDGAAQSRVDSELHIIVDKNGVVEAVTLHSPSNLYRDRMLVSAAKAWRFTPAVRDGRPVRYELRLPIAP